MEGFVFGTGRPQGAPPSRQADHRPRPAALLLLATSSQSRVGVQALVDSTAIGGDSAYGTAYDSAKGEIFAANSSGSNAFVISDATNSVTGVVDAGIPGSVLGSSPPKR